MDEEYITAIPLLFLLIALGVSVVMGGLVILWGTIKLFQRYNPILVIAYIVWLTPFYILHAIILCFFGEPISRYGERMNDDDIKNN